MKSRTILSLAAILSAAALLLCACNDKPGDPSSSGSSDSTTSKTEPGPIDPGSDEFSKPVRVPVADNLPDNALPGFESVWVPEWTAMEEAAPGGAELPAIGKESAEGAPVFSDFTDLTYPDETLAMTGEGLDGASLLVWAEGGMKEVKPLRTDNSKLQAVVPADMEKSLMIVWPQNDKGVGSPVRVNAPEIWWSDQSSLQPEKAGGEIRFFGSSLSIEGKTPIVYAVHENGKQEKLEIVDANPYQIRAKYPSQMTDGSRCKFYIHNGTGGDYGWSDAYMLDTAARTTTPEADLPVFNVEEYGAKADDGVDDSAAIQKALTEARKQKGGVILFGKGEYNLSRQIDIADKFPKGLYLRGAGEGEYDFKSSLSPSEYDHRGVTGTYTLLRFANPELIPQYMLNVAGSHVTVQDMTINGGDDGMHLKFNVFVSGEDITFKNVRLIKSDVRDFQTSGNANLICTTNLEIDNASKDITVENCEFHTKASAISIGNIEGIWPWGYFDSSRTVRNIRVNGCDFYGYTSPYTHPSGRKPEGDEGEISRGVTAINMDGASFENCTFQGYDRANCKLLVRGFYIGLGTKNTYIANNVLKDVGNITASGYDKNTGEQILFHGQDAIGGIFNVRETKGNDLTVRTDNIELRYSDGKEIKPADTTTNAGSQVFNGFDKGTWGAVYVCGGKGAGQVRTVLSYDVKDDSITFTLEEPFAVEPDDTSIITLTAPFTQNTVYHNTIANDQPTLEEGLKTGGVLLFYENYKNIIAENEIRNLAFGVAINSTFKMPSLWNTVRDNTMSGIQELRKNAMQGGDSTLDASFFCDSVRGNAGESAGWDEYNIWYTVGNVFRGNHCSDGDTAGELITNRWNLNNPGLDTYFGEEKGNAMSIIENNTYTNVAQGISVGNPAYWSLIRNNSFTFKEKAGYKAEEVCNDHPWTNFKLLYIVDDNIKMDANDTCK